MENSSTGSTIAFIHSFTFQGIDAIPVTVEVQLTKGLPAFIIVGMANRAVAEAKERVRGALNAMNLSLPTKRILVNLAPSNLPKEGAHLDLPIALALLAAMGVIPLDMIHNTAALGELSLTGEIKNVRGILCASLEAAKEELSFICPQQQGADARWGHSEMPVLAAPTLLSLVNHFHGRQILPPVGDPLPQKRHKGLDMKDIRGQALGRRVIEIAAAGRHSLLMSGPPGAGKSMLASRLPSLLPPLTKEEILEASRIHSIAGTLEAGHLVSFPPFRSPHHTASGVALTGGGNKIIPGEISLAHKGVLFLDELPEFSRSALEALRQPLEEGKITVARASGHLTFPARFQFIAAMNPCRCGHLGLPGKECSKAPRCAESYASKISGPLLDRMDMRIGLMPLSPTDITHSPMGEASEPIRQRVEQARQKQYERQNIVNAYAPIEKLLLSCSAKNFTEKASKKMGLSARGITRLLRVSRTIADLDYSEKIEINHVAEALNYRLS
ncbi:ATP-binding protein [Acetobacteraceae bacterium]|nr:ATP-binding protein [Acetobacteraceae bacterium]